MPGLWRDNDALFNLAEADFLGGFSGGFSRRVAIDDDPDAP
jgi:hypothetical protein